MMPSCDQTGVPIHFHSSMTSGSASLISLRILRRVSPRQSPSSAILFEMSFDADSPWLAPDFFMFSSSCAGRPSVDPQTTVEETDVREASFRKERFLAIRENVEQALALHSDCAFD